jgi:DNA-binding transcriptional LysR family regulator
MSNAASPSLEQLRVFIAVAETGSFSAAALQLNRAQSAISYAVAHLEGLLGCALFERARRRPVLTEAGRALLADARRLDLMMRELTARAEGLTRGLEGEVSLAVDVMFPDDRLVKVLQEFALAFPTVALNLQMEPIGGVLKLVVEGECDFGISGPNENWPDAIEASDLGSVRLIPVAAPRHALAAISGRIPIYVLRQHTQLVLTDRSRLTAGKTFGVYGTRTWKLGDLGAKHRLLLAGLGWGTMPEHMVHDDIQSARLVNLELADRSYVVYRLALIQRVYWSAGPAAQWLMRQLASVTPGMPHAR